jgi:AraC-like DNA-binding protein
VDTMPLKTLNTLLRVVIDQGYPIDRALQQIDLDFNPLEVSDQHHQEIAASSYSKLYRLLMEILQDEAFGLGQAYHAPPGTFRMMCLFIIHCATLEQALIRSWEFHEYCDQYRDTPTEPGPWPLLPQDDDDKVLCLFQRSVDNDFEESIAHANVLLMMYRFYSWLIAKPLPLLAVHLRAPQPDETTHYEDLFGCTVLFGQSNSGLLLTGSVLQHPVAQTEDSLKDFLRQSPYQLVKRERPGSVNTISQRVEQLLTGYTSQKLPNADQIAQKLNMSPRTLHRRLTNEATSFQQIKDDFRQELAVHYVSRPELTIDTIATLMGFQDNSAFYRSFKKWTGMSPGAFRQSLQERND